MDVLSRERLESVSGPYACYLAAEDFVDDLVTELGDAFAQHGRLLAAPGPPRSPAWALNVWRNPRIIGAPSISAGAKALKSLQRNWAGLQVSHFRRAALVQQQLPHVSARPLVFPERAPATPLGSWTLLDERTILASPDCTSAFPNGEMEFVEDHENPPSRAYLKLWEALTLLGIRPAAGEVCVDLGASPGGWTWALQTLGARVIAVDKAPLAPGIAALPGVEYREESAFAIDPVSLRPVDWVFSDVVCYPSRLLKLAQRWLDAGCGRRFVFTIKFQGSTDHEAARQFARLPNSRVVHLHHNKHELTWMAG